MDTESTGHDKDSAVKVPVPKVPVPEVHVPKVLIGDDEADVLKALRLLFKPEGYHVETASSAAAMLNALRRTEFDAVLMDMNYLRGNTSGEEGLSLLSEIQKIDSTLPVIVMTAWIRCGLGRWVQPKTSALPHQQRRHDHLCHDRRSFNSYRFTGLRHPRVACQSHRSHGGVAV